MKKKNISQEIEFEEGSTNVFADLGFENPEEELFKADLTAEIARIIKRKKLTQTQVAEMLGVDQPRISRLLKGHTNLFSIEMLMLFLNALGQDIEVSIKPKPRRRKSRAHCTVVSCPKIPVSMVAKSRVK